MGKDNIINEEGIIYNIKMCDECGIITKGIKQYGNDILCTKCYNEFEEYLIYKATN